MGFKLFDMNFLKVFLGEIGDIVMAAERNFNAQYLGTIDD